MRDKKLKPFTSESVSEGHPDKVCDQISDAMVDACLAKDPHARVACECYASNGLVIVGGEITTKTYVNVQELARNVVRDIGYTNPAYGIDSESMAVLNAIRPQSPDIAQGVDGRGLAEYEGQQGAGDQGMMFGFACTETPQLMPAPIMYAHGILQRAAALRKAGAIRWLRPDAKSQVSVEYAGHKPVRISNVVVSHQHDPDVDYPTIRETLIEEVIKPVLASSGLLDADTVYYINPTGRFVTGGPGGDTGLTGRKIIVDSYGGMGRHGGGAFSGKDPSKVDRSGAYMARYVAKNIVAAGLGDVAEVQIAYAIGVAEPVSVVCTTHGTGNVADDVLTKAVREVFDLRPYFILKRLDLRRPIYRLTTNYGHFGRELPEFTWEKTDAASDLKTACKI